MHTPTAARPIPFTVIAGFLGAGKTTLLNRILLEAEDTRFAVLVNDFGSLNLDALLVEANGGRCVALSNGCVCCSIGDSFIDTLLQILARPEQVDHIVVEASGISQPRRIADIAVLEPLLLPDGIVVVVDAEQVRDQAADRYIGETVRRQLEAADLLVINKCDLVSRTQLDELEVWLHGLNPHAGRAQSRQADVPTAVLAGAALPPGVRMSTPLSMPKHAHFAHARVVLPGRLSREACTRALEGLPRSVLRVKGFVRFSDAPGVLMLVQKVGPRCSLNQVPASPLELPEGELALVGTRDMPASPELTARFTGDGIL